MHPLRQLDLPPGASLGPGDSAYQRAAFKGCLFMGWYGEVSAEGLEAWRAGVSQVAQQFGTVGLVTCVRESSPPPEGEIRRQVANLMFGDEIYANVLVFEGTGFRAAIVRSVLAAMFAIAPRRIAHKVISNSEEGSQWFYQQCQNEAWCPSQADLYQVMTALLTTT